MTRQLKHSNPEHGRPKEAASTSVDLTPYLDGTIKPVVPKFGFRDDGVPLLYPGKTHALVGESEAGKTWLALWWCVQLIKMQHYVLFFDFEDDANGITERLLILGLTAEEILDYFTYVDVEHMKGGPDIGLAEGKSLAIIDGVTEAMALVDHLGLGYGGANDWSSTYARFLMFLPNLIVKKGPAVLMLDHPAKADADKPTRYASGSGHKLRGLSGASYTLFGTEPVGRGVTGRSAVYCGKDRPGHMRQHGTWDARIAMTNMGTMIVDSRDDTTTVTLSGRTEVFLPTVLMARVSEAAAAEPEKWWTKNGLQKATKGDRNYVFGAIDALVKEGYLITRRVDETRLQYQHAKDYQGPGC